MSDNWRERFMDDLKAQKEASAQGSSALAGWVAIREVIRMELEKKLVLEGNEITALEILLGEMPSGVIANLVDEGKMSLAESQTIGAIYELISG